MLFKDFKIIKLDDHGNSKIKQSILDRTERGYDRLQPSCLKAANIIFYSTPTAIPLKPYIHADKLEDSPHNASCNVPPIGEIDNEIGPDDLSSRSYLDIVMLAIILMELYMTQSTEELAKQAGIESGEWEQIILATPLLLRFLSDSKENSLIITMKQWTNALIRILGSIRMTKPSMKRVSSA
jgi:hypothetical protein